MDKENKSSGRYKFIFYALLICCFFPSKAKSQNWIPYNHINVCNYSTSDLFSDIATIRTDSFHIIGADTVFYLSSIIADSTIPPYNLPIVLPQFLMKTVRNIGNNYFVFKDTSEFIFKINSFVGDSWIFDSIHAITATVSSIIHSSVFGEPDSIKCIALSSLDTLLLSKNFGIISFKIPNTNFTYKLKGIENRNLGYRVPQYLDFFNFNQGDVFEYKEIYQHNGKSSSSRAGTTIHYKLTILDKMILKDGYHYYTEKNEVDSSWAYGRDSEVIYKDQFDSLICKNDSNSCLNYYNHQRFQGTKVDFSYDTLFNVDVKKYDAVPSPTQESAAYGVGVGLTTYYNYQYDFAGGDNRIYKYLTGCKKGNTVHGIINPGFYFTENESIVEEDRITIFPNPSSNYITIQSAIPFSIVDFRIYDLDGCNKLSGKITDNNRKITISSLSSGIYILKIFSGNMIWAKPIMKM
jgi:hypothetical protein